MLMGAFFGDLRRRHRRLVARRPARRRWSAGGALALVHAVFSVSLRADQIVGGIAINFLALGITGYLYVDHYGDQGTPDNISRVPDITLPLGQGHPVRRRRDRQANLLTWLALIAVVACRRSCSARRAACACARSASTRARPRPSASRSSGTRYLAVDRLRRARGARRRVPVDRLPRLVQPEHDRRPRVHRARRRDLRQVAPGRRARRALLFGFSSALAQRLPTFSESGAVLFQALPYVLTIIAVAGVIGRSRPPAAVGSPYVQVADPMAVARLSVHAARGARARPPKLSRRGRALPAHVLDAAALERRDAAARARALAPRDGLEPAPARRLATSSTSARSSTRSGACPAGDRARAA